MKFIYYDLIFLILFGLGLIIFLYKRRKNLKREGVMYLYRTQVGVKIINYVGGKYKRTLKVLSYMAVVCGYILMIAMIFLLGQLAYIYLRNPEIVKMIKIPPLMPLIPYLDKIVPNLNLRPFYFTYWIIAIAIIAIFHEFAHGVFSKYNKIKIKTTGFGFLGPFLAAFVEPDEKQMQKKSKFAQISILSAGTFANLILAGLFFLLLAGFFMMSYVPAGAIFNTYSPGVVDITDIKMLDGINIINPSNQGLLKVIENNNITNDLVLGFDGNSVNFTKIVVNDKNYYITIENLKEQLGAGEDYILLYEDFPAINAGLRGVIIEIDDNKITNHEDLSRVMKNYVPGDEINVQTKSEDENGEKEILEFDLILAEDPGQKGRAIIGVGVIDSSSNKIIWRISRIFDFFKEPSTYYEPRFDSNLIVFIYNLIWWLALVNISVALINMLPMGIFDGGRMFMLTVWGITRSEKIGKAAYKIMTYLILGVFLLLMLSWVFAIF